MRELLSAFEAQKWPVNMERPNNPGSWIAKSLLIANIWMKILSING
jgi:hypothetical protein